MLTEEKRLAKNAYAREWKRRNKESVNATNKKWKDENRDLVRSRGREEMARARSADPERFSEIGKRYREKHVDTVKGRIAKWRAENPGYHNEWHQKKRQVDRLRYLLYSAKMRARKLGLPFGLTKDDVSIPTHCPVLGIEIRLDNKQGFLASSPSIDRIIPELGYVPGNVRVISYRANALKKDGTAEELMAVASWVARETVRIRLEMSEAA